MERKFYIFHTVERTFFQEQVGVLAALLQLSLVIYLLVALLLIVQTWILHSLKHTYFEFYSDQSVCHRQSRWYRIHLAPSGQEQGAVGGKEGEPLPLVRSSSIVCQETKAMAREVRPGLAVEVISFILSFGFCPSDTISWCRCSQWTSQLPTRRRLRKQSWHTEAVLITHMRWGNLILLLS